MTTQDIIQYLNQKCKLILAGYGGSHAYGTNIPTSDIDIRGIYINPEDEILGMKADSEQITIPNEDVVIYSIRKMFNLLSKCNPNVIEILGLRPEDYLFSSDEGQLILDNKEIFLSKQAIFTFGSYAKAQLNRLMNKSGRAKEAVTENETRSLQKVITHIKQQESLQNIRVEFINETPTLYINEAMPIEQFYRVSQELLNVHSDYRRSVRNDKATDHGKLPKHMMHLIRLYMMGSDILDKHEIITYRSEEHDLLMDIRNGKYMCDDGITPSPEFEKLIQEYTIKFENAALHSTLPDKPNMQAINDLLIRILRKYY